MTTTTNINLSAFCATEDTRYQWSRPWVAGGYRYATDARICVRIPAPGEPDTEGTFPASASIFSDADAERATKPVELIACRLVDRNASCADCYGSGEVGGKTKCDECKGKGEVTCGECGHEHDCEECEGEGEIDDGPLTPCPDCAGRGKWVERDAHFGGVVIAGKYWSEITKLPGLQISLPTKSGDPLWFVFDGGEGAVMPVRR